VAGGETAVIHSTMEPMKTIAHLVGKPGSSVGPPEKILKEPFQKISEGDSATGKQVKTCLYIGDPSAFVPVVVPPEKAATEKDQQEENVRNV